MAHEVSSAMAGDISSSESILVTNLRKDDSENSCWKDCFSER